jgi:hypothetical protein
VITAELVLSERLKKNMYDVLHFLVWLITLLTVWQCFGEIGRFCLQDEVTSICNPPLRMIVIAPRRSSHF